jgi:uncharacterized protein YrzB (UPF0473 family)
MKHNSKEKGFCIMSHNDHIHDENCNHDHEFQTITLTLDDGKELNCNVIGIFEVEDTEYVALLPENEDEVFLYQFKELDDGEIQLDNIESEEEYEKVSEIFMELMDNEDFDFEDDEDFDEDEE